MSDWTIMNCVSAGNAKKTSGNDIRTAQPTRLGEGVCACMVSICIADKNIFHANFRVCGLVTMPSYYIVMKIILNKLQGMVL